MLHPSAGGFQGHKIEFAGSQSATEQSACEERLGESDNLAEPEVLAQDIVDDLEVALERSREIFADGVGKFSEF